MARLPWDLDLSPASLPSGVSIDLSYDPATSRLSGTLTNESDHSVALERPELVASPGRAAAGGFAWLHGRYMQQDALVHAFGSSPDPTYSGALTLSDANQHRFRSHELVAISLLGAAEPAIVFGSLEPTRCFVDFEIATDPEEQTLDQLIIRFDLRGIQLAAGASIDLPAVYVAAGPDALELVDRFALEAGRELQARVPERVPTGWCSWYFFYNRVSESDILANLDALASSPSRVDYVQIDDGYQAHTGDWLSPNERFPSGMAALAARIRESGFRPGIWLAPLVLNENSGALRENPAIVLKTPDGDTYWVETWLGRCAVLDCTHPAAEAWLRNVVRTVVHDWGYEYLKLDALSYAAATPGRVLYHMPNTTAPANLRRGLEIIRDAAGAHTFILGCTCHFGPAIGLVDAMRVGPDVKAAWFEGLAPSVRHAMRMTLQRNWMHRRWWINDPDCLIVRDTHTALTEEETRFLVAGIALSGGMVVLSDDLPAVPPSRRELAGALLPPPGIAARPVDAGEPPVPSLWRVSLGEGRHLVGALNWNDEPRWVPRDLLLRPGEAAFDVFERRVLGMGDRLLRAHEAVLLQVAAPGATPRVVGDSGHLTFNGLFQRQVSGRLQLRNDGPQPRTVAVEARGRVFEIDLAPREMRWFD